MTKKYPNHRHNTSFWQNLATLLAPNDEKLLYTTRIIHKKVEECGQDEAKRPAPVVAGPSFDQVCQVPSC